MKKLSALLITLLVAVGLAAATPAAEAAYPGTVRTYAHINWKHNPTSHRRVAQVRFWVTTAGTGHPHGLVSVRAFGKDRSYARIYRYYGGKVYHPFRKMVKGTYHVWVRYYPPNGSVYKGTHRQGFNLVVR